VVALAVRAIQLLAALPDQITGNATPRIPDPPLTRSHAKTPSAILAAPLPVSRLPRPCAAAKKAHVYFRLKAGQPQRRELNKTVCRSRSSARHRRSRLQGRRTAASSARPSPLNLLHAASKLAQVMECSPALRLNVASSIWRRNTPEINYLGWYITGGCSHSNNAAIRPRAASLKALRNSQPAKSPVSLIHPERSPACRAPRPASGTLPFRRVAMRKTARRNLNQREPPGPAADAHEA
jgi:hypothetical protein